ncbi:MAG: hypothetical protein ACHQ1H_04270 [Nitrososphaerales archaeon]
MNTKKALAIVGFVILGLSPSFVDWQQTPEKRKQMILFYAVGVTMIWYGILKG